MYIRIYICIFEYPHIRYFTGSQFRICCIFEYSCDRSTSQCVYFVRPNTLLLCIFLFCTFLLYCKDPQVEVQIRILLKDKYVKSCQNANTGNHTMISCTQFLRKFLLGFLYFTETTRPTRYIYPNFLLLCISFLHCMDLQPYSHNRFSKISRTFFACRYQ